MAAYAAGVNRECPRRSRAAHSQRQAAARRELSEHERVLAGVRHVAYLRVANRVEGGPMMNRRVRAVQFLLTLLVAAACAAGE